MLKLAAIQQTNWGGTCSPGEMTAEKQGPKSTSNDQSGGTCKECQPAIMPESGKSGVLHQRSSLDLFPLADLRRRESREQHQRVPSPLHERCCTARLSLLLKPHFPSIPRSQLIASSSCVFYAACLILILLFFRLPFHSSLPLTLRKTRSGPRPEFDSLYNYNLR